MVIFVKTAAFALLALLGGTIVSYVNYRVMKASIKKGTDKQLLAVSPLRSLLSAAYLFALFFLGVKTGVSSAALLIGGALGLTISLAFFTKLLLKPLKVDVKELDKENTDSENNEGSDSV